MSIGYSCGMSEELPESEANSDEVPAGDVVTKVTPDQAEAAMAE